MINSLVYLFFAGVTRLELITTVLETGMIPFHHTPVLRLKLESNQHKGVCSASPNHSVIQPYVKEPKNKKPRTL